MDALIEFIAVTVYALAVSTALVLMSRPVRWVLRATRALLVGKEKGQIG